ncbi:MAG: DUF4956 domain-containing protein [Acidobacteriota bacterium]
MPLYTLFDWQIGWQLKKEKGKVTALVRLFIFFILIANATPLPAQTDDGKAKTNPPAISAGNANQEAHANQNESFFSKLFGSQASANGVEESLSLHVTKIAISFLLAALLAAALAYRPRKKMMVSQNNPYVAQTQILLSVTAAAMMMIVSDNAARAFGIFAAASLVRYRTNIRDPKETSVLLACLAIGLASGVRRWEIALVLTIFMMLLLMLLESLEPKQVFRTMELKIKSRNVEKTDLILKRIFKKRNIKAELRKIDLPDEENSFGSLLYFINVHPIISTDRLTDDFFAADPDNIDKIEWQQKKSQSYIYR